MTCKECIHSGVCYKENDYDNFPDRCGEFISDKILEERPQGKWIKITKNGTIPVEYICSVCGRKIFDNYELSVPQSVYYPFCHCGADMRGEE